MPIDKNKPRPCDKKNQDNNGKCPGKPDTEDKSDNTNKP